MLVSQVVQIVNHTKRCVFFWGGGGMVHLMGSKKSWCSPPKNLQMSSQTKSQENADSLEKLEPYVRPSVYICVLFDIFKQFLAKIMPNNRLALPPRIDALSGNS